jgi:cytochrome c553
MSRLTRWSIAALAALTVAALLVGFVWLPSAQPDFTAAGVWDMICRAAGVPARWSGGAAEAKAVRSTRVVLDASMARPGAEDAIGRGGTLALQCTMCHGPRGISEANSPNLAGQYPEVIVKQLLDYQHGDRTSAIMQSLAAGLTRQNIDDLAAYYSYLPKPRNAPVTDMSIVPALVRVGDPMRNIAPCASCHGGIDRKAGAPWLEGMPKEYLVQQLAAFAEGRRRNDSHAQMRNMARAMTAQEIDAVSDFYARHGEGEQLRSVAR